MDRLPVADAAALTRCSRACPGVPSGPPGRSIGAIWTRSDARPTRGSPRAGAGRPACGRRGRRAADGRRRGRRPSSADGTPRRPTRRPGPSRGPRGDRAAPVGSRHPAPAEDARSRHKAPGGSAADAAGQGPAGSAAELARAREELGSNPSRHSCGCARAPPRPDARAVASSKPCVCAASPTPRSSAATPAAAGATSRSRGCVRSRPRNDRPGGLVTERTLVLVKPDGVQRLLVGRILARLRGARPEARRPQAHARRSPPRRAPLRHPPRQAVLRGPRRLHHLRARSSRLGSRARTRSRSFGR